VNLAVAWTSAATALRRYGRSAFVVTIVIGAAVMAAAPALTIGPALDVTPIGADDWGVSWTSHVQGPDVARQRGLGALVNVLTIATIALVAVALLTIISVAIARAAPRRREVIVHRAVGASRRIIGWSATIEGTVVAVVGVAIGIVGARLIYASLTHAWPGSRGSVDVLMACVVTAVFALVAILGGLLPLVFARSRAPGADDRAARVPLFVPSVQFGIGLLGVIAGAQLGQALPSEAVQATPVSSGIVVPLPQRDSGYEELLSGLRRDPRLTLVSIASPGTLLGLGTVDFITTECGRCYRGGLPLPLHVVRAANHLASADTFRALEIAVVEGRGFTDADRRGATPVAVVSRSLAERDFEGGRAVGRRVRVGPPGSWYTVVGIVEDGRFVGLGANAQSPFRVYLSALQHPGAALELLVRGKDLTSTFIGQSEHALLERERATTRWFAQVLNGVGAAALFVALLGMVAVMRMWVRGEIPNIAVRRMVGARRRHVLGRVALRALGIVGGGMAIAWWLEPLLSDVVRGVLAGVPIGGVSLVRLPLAVLLVATLMTALGPTWRAARAAPATLPGPTDL
jgi:putative ABC transport system permease protein